MKVEGMKTHAGGNMSLARGHRQMAICLDVQTHEEAAQSALHHYLWMKQHNKEAERPVDELSPQVSRQGKIKQQQ